MVNFQEIFNRCNITAPKRELRPFINKEDLTCPFCLNNEKCLEAIIDECWQDEELYVRIVPNRYPVTSIQGAKGHHDVVIDTKDHHKHPRDFSTSHWEVLLETMQKRWNHLMEEQPIEFVQIFKNYGIKAGASISHSHWQIVALEEIPYSMLAKYHAFEQSNACYCCQLSSYSQGYLVWEDEWTRVWVPPIPEYPYEVWLIPKKHHQHYGELSKEELQKLGQLIKYLLEVYHQMNPQGDFNICMMSGDVKGKYPYHFYIQLVMRTGHIAGFEIATGCHILSVEPMAYAKEMKKILKGMYK